MLITSKDIEEGSLKKESVLIVPKITVIDAGLITSSRKIATLKNKSFERVLPEMCTRLECINTMKY